MYFVKLGTFERNFINQLAKVLLTSYNITEQIIRKDLNARDFEHHP